MQQRIKAVRRANKLTQVEFGKRIGVKGNTVTGYETGLRLPSESVLLAICREFDVSEPWLRTGEGEMKIQRTASEDISSFLGDVLSCDQSDFRHRLLHTLSRLEPGEWQLLEKIAAEVSAKKTGP